STSPRGADPRTTIGATFFSHSVQEALGTSLMARACSCSNLSGLRGVPESAGFQSSSAKINPTDAGGRLHASERDHSYGQGGRSAGVVGGGETRAADEVGV